MFVCLFALKETREKKSFLELNWNLPFGFDKMTIL